MDSRGFEPRLPDFDPASTIHLKSKIWGIFWKVSPAPLPTYVATFTNLKWGTRIKQVVLCRGGCGARTHKAILCTHWFSRPTAQPIHATLHCSPTKTRTWVRSLGNFRSIPLNYRAQKHIQVRSRTGSLPFTRARARSATLPEQYWTRDLNPPVTNYPFYCV